MRRVDSLLANRRPLRGQGGSWRGVRPIVEGPNRLRRASRSQDRGGSATGARRLLPEIYKVFNLKVTRREPYKIGCYPAEKGGHFRPHRDNFDPALFYRRLAMSINLNDGFQGGGLIFPEYGNDEYRPGPGCVLVFPCALVHGVTRVTGGERFMMNSFLYSEYEHQQSDEWHRRHGGARQFDDRLFVEW